MFRDLYSAELEYLHRLCESVGAENPRIAPILGRGADPSVTRLVQNVAFAAARLRQRLDDDAPEWIHPVVEALRPELLRPFPSATIVELLPEATMKEPEMIPAGASFGSRPVDGASCRFRSCADVTVRPWRLVEASLAAERTELRLRIEVQDGAKIPALTGPLRLFLALSLSAALELRSVLLHGTEAVFARAPGKAPVSMTTPGEPPARAVPPAALPCSEAEHDARLDLRTYFAWPEAFAFVDVGDLAPLEGIGPAFEIIVRFRDPLPRHLAVDTAAVRLHCVPAVNVHRMPGVSLALVDGRASVELPLAGAQVYALERVALVRGDLTMMPAEPFARFFPPPLLPDGRLPILYRVERAASVVGPDLAVRLAFISFDPRARLEDVATVDVDLFATDGARAPRLGAGDVCVGTPTSPALVTFRNITAVSRSAPPDLESDRLWRQYQMLRATFAQLSEATYLSEALALANVAASARWPEAKPDAASFRPLLAVRTQKSTRAERSEASAGAAVAVDLDLDAFAGPGDVGLFGERLSAFLAASVRPHEWISLTLCDARGAAVRAYPPTLGSRVEL